MAEKKAKDNMELWDLVCKTDPTITKKVEQRGGFTAICAQSQIKRATELWGSYGIKWGVKDCTYEHIVVKIHTGDIETEVEEQPGISLTAVFYYPDGEFEIASDMYYKPRDDCMKKLLTDLTTKALSKLGFNSDVFEGKFDDNKYVESMKKEFENDKKEPKKPKVKLPPNSNLYFTASEIKDMEDGKKTEKEILAETEHRIHLKGNWDYLTPIVMVEVRIVRNNPKLYDWDTFKESTLDNDIFIGITDENKVINIKSWKTHNRKEKEIK